MDQVLEVPVRRFVAKYIESKFSAGNHIANAWRVNKWCKEGRMLISLIERTPYRYEKFSKNEVFLYIKIPSRLVCTKGAYLSQASVNEFIAYIYDLILEEIEDYCNDIKSGAGLKDCKRVNIKMDDGPAQIRKINVEAGLNFFSQKDMVQSKLKKYQLTDDDLTFDAVVKQLQRRSKRKKSA